MLMKSYDHNIRIREMEKGARGLIRRGGDKRHICLDGLRFEIVEEVLDFLGVPRDEERRRHFRHLLGMASTIDSDPNKIENRLRKIALEVEQMNS